MQEVGAGILRKSAKFSIAPNRTVRPITDRMSWLDYESRVRYRVATRGGFDGHLGASEPPTRPHQ